MEGFAAFVPFMIMFGVVLSIVKAANKQAQKRSGTNSTTPMSNEEVRARL